ncbi:thioredoxin [Aerococcus urinaehominis]|uniref:Thioredoxin n=1 Tax=Aerococcus urinaehominis TaxID=128944 RepID=A0A0X8FMF2_9LACT|nr:DsbA family protein [Aerococcus urinaehominis]AMC00004.1 thioredoxin [Aerococcus urinaehominis]SDL82293.1 Predicted dithiol-disulfide isomerase, DsbA family [Aerococcus urinaehominis]
MQIEFFHDVICSFCFPMSARMRKIQAKYPSLEIIHRSFALGWEVSQFEQMFGSHAAVKDEVLSHWEHANQNDDDHRFNIAGMAASDFLFPTSKPGLIAAKAAGLVGGQAAYWDAFDAIQTALFVDNQDIADPAVLKAAVAKTDIDLAAWQDQVDKPETEEAVLQDLAQVQAYGIQGAPALVINQKYLISGAQDQATIEANLAQIAQQEGETLIAKLDQVGQNGQTCHFENGQWHCD